MNQRQVRLVEVASIVDSVLFKAARRIYRKYGSTNAAFQILDDLRDSYDPEVMIICLEEGIDLRGMRYMNS